MAAVPCAAYSAAAALYLACTRLLARTGPADLASRAHPPIPTPGTATDPTGDPSPLQERR
ncbi:hypothetical protein [Frankia tisae]|uniref:hypothetical protein n=1 Tax=Frankia tisae TaxID=2950104 RepID=UPI0021C171F9|nr:hypothetical protein [Frankia tisae]